jgi:hypothetical protein
MKTKFTVVLMRPNYVADTYGQDCYVAYVEAANVYRAREEGQKEAWESDNNGFAGEGSPKDSPDDYHPLLVFKGHQEVKLFGFQN